MSTLVEYDNFHEPAIDDDGRRCGYVLEDGDFCALLDYEHDATPEIADRVLRALAQHPVPEVWRAAQDLGNALSLWEDDPNVSEPGGPFEPRCDICGEREGEGEADWNGETGNHLSCEAGKRAANTGFVHQPDCVWGGKDHLGFTCFRLPHNR